ncbi:MATE family efflux transporter [Chakrabartyella piscis]|uniref:MATE family efflux transporter n=1 Tax=Chakrabartyella piscis TaxID=2918914 RepID=UPI003A7F5828
MTDEIAKSQGRLYFSGRDLRRLIVPLIIEQTLAIFVGMCDSIMVASVGEHAVSGVSLVDNIFILLIFLFGSLATGGAVVAGQYLGKRENKKACEATDQLVLFTGALSIIITLCIYLCSDLILHNVFGNIADDVMESAKVYLLIGTASIPFLAVYNGCSAVFRSMGNSKVSMYLSLLMNAINVGGNALLIFGYGMGVKGAAIATLVSRVVACIGVVVLLRKQDLLLHMSKKFVWKPNGHMIRKIAHIGIPSGLESSMFQMGKIMVLAMIAPFGTASIAANAVTNITATFQSIPGTAVGLALIAVSSRCVGAGDYEMARYYTRKIMKLIHVLLFIFSAAILVALPLILEAYQLSEEATRLTYTITWLHGVLVFLYWPESFSLPNTLRSANDVKYCMYASIFSMWVFRIGFSYILGVWLDMGLIGIWIAMFIDWFVRALFFVLRYRGTKWQQHKI